ncbi:hypothetical protein BGZ76_009786 [Entomortierella beljakovae]|nr:hypothetical protein BGZ76_009786 [Entomortierella beljakovae]
MANHLNGAYRPLSRPRQRIALSATCSPQNIQQQKLVFASGAIGTASALGHVFGRPLQAKETIPCSHQNCNQLQKELQNTQIQQAQSPSHTFQQQCSIHKRFRLFRQRPRKCPVHSSPSSGPTYILPPTTVHPLVIHPDKILLDHHDNPPQSSSWKNPLTSSTSVSSRLSSYSNISLSLSISSFNQGSDSENYSSSTFQSKKKKKQSKKEQQQARCICYLDATLDHQDIPKKVKEPTLSSSSWYPQKHQKEPSRFRRMWNDSTIFWSKSSSPDKRSNAKQPQQESQNTQRQQIQSNGSFEYMGSPLDQYLQSKSNQNDISQRNSLASTDFSEGSHLFSELEIGDEYGTFTSSNSYYQSNSYSSKSRRPGDDLKAISRHQAELSQLPSDFHEYGTDIPPIHESRPLAATFVADTEDGDDDEDEDWDLQSDIAPSSSPMYSAGAREPTSYSTVALPLSSSKGYPKKSSSANLNTLRSRQRCLSLPTDSAHSGFKRLPSTPSENWDEDFDIDSGDINVPTKVIESQISLQMDIYNIKDFALQIEDLKSLRASLRLASSSLKAKNPKKHQDLSLLFQRDWEQAEVIINLGEIAQTSTSPSSEGSALAAGPLSLQSGTSSSSSNMSQNNFHSQNHRRPPLPAAGAGNPISAMSSLLLNSTERSISQSSSLTGTTIAGSSASGDSETDVASCTSSRSSSASSSMAVDIETAVEGLALAQHARRRPNLGSSVAPLKSTQMKESYSSPAAFGLCTTPVTPLPTRDPEMYSSSEFEPNSRWDRHIKEDSSATLRAAPLTSNPSNVGGNIGDESEIEASFRRYKKYNHRPRGRIDEEEDMRYESYDYEYSDGSIGVITPIPSDRHMQVLKDILIDGLGSEVARRYMFRKGEQDHVRFSVEVIPGLLGHLKDLQQRLGNQLMELQQLTVLV